MLYMRKIHEGGDRVDTWISALATLMLDSKGVLVPDGSVAAAVVVDHMHAGPSAIAAPQMADRRNRAACSILTCVVAAENRNILAAVTVVNAPSVMCTVSQRRLAASAVHVIKPDGSVAAAVVVDHIHTAPSANRLIFCSSYSTQNLYDILVENTGIRIEYGIVYGPYSPPICRIECLLVTFDARRPLDSANYNIQRTT